MILVITHTQEHNEYDQHGRLLFEEGEVYVSHGVDLDSGKSIPLPEEKFRNFIHHCIQFEGEWCLK